MARSFVDGTAEVDVGLIGGVSGTPSFALAIEVAIESVEKSARIEASSGVDWVNPSVHVASDRRRDWTNFKVKMRRAWISGSAERLSYSDCLTFGHALRRGVSVENIVISTHNNNATRTSGEWRVISSMDDQTIANGLECSSNSSAEV